MVIFLPLLYTGAMFTLAGCSVVIALRRQYPPPLRFGPLVVVGVYLAAGLIHFILEGVASFVMVPISCVGLYLGCRMLSHHSALAYTFAASSFVFWSGVLFVFSRYLMAIYFNR